ncbi:fumarylacetoacetate hydrolase family protein [Halobacillus litoralis]|nr:fumarylacetoacetate hydrolase family protein [Halobacillus litoralis]
MVMDGLLVGKRAEGGTSVYIRGIFRKLLVPVLNWRKQENREELKEMEEIRNIYCVGRNYRKHAEELGNQVPSEPLIFMKPTHALHKAEGGLPLPFEQGAIHFEGELVVKMREDYHPDKPLDSMIGGMAFGIDFTARDVQSKLKEKGHPWTMAKGFPGSAVLSRFVPFPGEEAFRKVTFTLYKKEELVQKGQPERMIFPLRELVDVIGSRLGLSRGDIIFTGTPEGVGPVGHGDVFTFEMESGGQSYSFGPLHIQ